jgi:hypothetical protein
MSCCQRVVTNGALALVSTFFGAFGAEPNREYVVSTIAGGMAPVTPVAARNAAIGSISGMTVDLGGNVYLSTDLNCVFTRSSNEGRVRWSI